MNLQEIAVQAVVFVRPGLRGNANIFREGRRLRSHVVFEFPRFADVHNDRLALPTHFDIESHVFKLLRRGIDPAGKPDIADAKHMRTVSSGQPLGGDQTHVQAATRTDVRSKSKPHRVRADERRSGLIENEPLAFDLQATGTFHLHFTIQHCANDAAGIRVFVIEGRREPDLRRVTHQRHGLLASLLVLADPDHRKRLEVNQPLVRLFAVPVVGEDEGLTGAQHVLGLCRPRLVGQVRLRHAHVLGRPVRLTLFLGHLRRSRFLRDHNPGPDRDRVHRIQPGQADGRRNREEDPREHERRCPSQVCLRGFWDKSGKRLIIANW